LSVEDGCAFLPSSAVVPQKKQPSQQPNAPIRPLRTKSSTHRTPVSASVLKSSTGPFSTRFEPTTPKRSAYGRTNSHQTTRDGSLSRTAAPTNPPTLSYRAFQTPAPPSPHWNSAPQYRTRHAPTRQRSQPSSAAPSRLQPRPPKWWTQVAITSKRLRERNTTARGRTTTHMLTPSQKDSQVHGFNTKAAETATHAPARTSSRASPPPQKETREHTNT